MMDGPALLQVDGVVKRFYSLRAVDGVSFEIPAGSITGLIGPNGAGKTTCFNVLSGLLRPESGRVVFRGRDVTGAPPHRITRHGLARTFQNLQVFGRMTAIENVMVGRHARSRGGLLACALRWPTARRQERAIRNRAAALLSQFGLEEDADRPAGDLPFARQRQLEIARALATDPVLLLLDEPAAGLNPRETIGLAQRIRDLARTGLTLLIVEHDMDLIMEICERVIVLDAGRIIAAGSPREIQANPDVIRVYLGEADGGWGTGAI
jgi:branched-chain amino acid transport system ATP-binding protein